MLWREAVMKWRKSEKVFVDRARVARLATADARGVPHNVPICPLFDNGKIYFGTDVGTKKLRNIKANPNVAVVFDDYTEAWDHLRGITIQGEARVVDRQKFRRVRNKIYAKYLQYEPAAPLTQGDTAIVEVIPQEKFSWGF
jgi:nitroimidazol reductase NimA-like FMN-containing flavoprotein (pyridoxamine 5'-phosphate oxidase superfamily)